MDSNGYALAVTANVEEARREAGLSLLSLSAASGIPRTSLDRKLNHHGHFTVREICSLATVLGTTACALSTAGYVSAAA